MGMEDRSRSLWDDKPKDCNGKNKSNSNCKTNADPYGMTTKRAGNDNGKNNGNARA